MEEVKLVVNGKRLDGRQLNELRQIKMEVGVLNKADGSAYIEWGKNKILAAVYGPKECIPRHDIDPYKAILRCKYSMAPFSSLEEHGRAGPSRRSAELSKVIREVFESVVVLEQFPKTAIDIFIEVLQADGGTRCAGITATSLALANAGIPMKGLVCALAIGKIDGKMCIDPSKDEDNYGEADMPIAISPHNKKILLFQMDGLLTKEEIQQGVKMAFEGCEYIHKLQISALKNLYTKKYEY